MNKAYLLISIGPVQRAITQARRTQDVFMGSRILSYLARIGLNVVQPPAQIIFPQVELKTSSTPNHLFIRCPSEQAAQQLADDIYYAVSQAWVDAGERTREHFEATAHVTANPDIWRRQVGYYDEEQARWVHPWLEFYAVIAPDTGEYQKDFKEAQRLLSVRKMVRDFIPVDEPGDKCSVTGEHEALHDQLSGTAKLKQVQEYWDRVRAAQSNLSILSKGERLCALSVIKRMVHEVVPALSPEGRFPSTSSIASAVFRAALVAHWNDLKQPLGDYLNALEALFSSVGSSWYDLYFHHEGQLNPIHLPHVQNISTRTVPAEDRDLFTALCSLDGDFLYPEGLQAAAIQEYTRLPTPPTKEQLRPAVEALNALYEAARMCGIQRPSSYLAVLSMDGDRMGQQRFSDADQHRDFSQDLAVFAQDIVPRIIELERPGRVIYAGGDDVLALLPAEDALDAAEELRRRFAARFHKRELHVSVGIAYVHRTHPLQATIREAKAAQDRAKREFRRNAVAAALLQRSGEPLHMGMKWDVADPETKRFISTIDVVQNLVRAMVQGQVSRSLPYDLHTMIYAMADSNVSSGARWDEFKRVFKRRCQNGFDGTALASDIFALAEYGVQIDGIDSIRLGWEEIERWLRLARFLAGEESERVAVS
jgi:CRISPR-associated protein Cmr2